MARSFTFNGQTRLTPGGISRIRTNSVELPSDLNNGVVGLIGAAEGGPPGVITIIDDPQTGVDTFGSGPLADAIKIAFAPSSDPRVPAGASRVIAYKTNASTRASTMLPTSITLDSITVTSATSAVVTWSGSPVLTTDNRVGYWLTSAGEKRRVTANTATTMTVSPPFSTVPVTSSVVTTQTTGFSVTSRDYGVATNQISAEFEAGVTSGTYIVTVSDGIKTQQSPELGGAPALEVVYLGGAIPVQGAGSTPASGLTVSAATTTTVSATFATAPTAAQYANMLIVFSDGTRRMIASHTTSTSCVITLDASTPLTAAEAVTVVGETFSIRTTTVATASITGSLGSATGFSTAITMTPSSALDNLSLTFAAGETLRQFVARVNTGGKYLLSVPAGVNQDTTLMSTFDFGARATAVDIRFDHTVSYSTKGTFLRDLQTVVDWINNTAAQVSALRIGLLNGAELPAVTGGVYTAVRDTAVYLVNGSRGISTNTTFQAGFDAMLLNRVNHLVPLISYDLTNDGYGSTATFASVAAMTSAYADLANNGQNSEVGCYLGMSGTKTALATQSASLNNKNVALTGQKFTVLDTTNSLVEKPEWSSAVAAAGQRAGMPDIGEPITFKRIKTTGISNDSSWSSKNPTDRNFMIQKGLLFAEAAPNGGFRWVRDISTYVSDDNPYNIEGSVIDATRWLVYDFRTSIVEQFTGEARAATVANIREFASARLTQYYKAGVLVDSNDPEDPTSSTIINGFRRLKVSIVGNTANIKAEVYVIEGLVFSGFDITVQVPQLTA